MAKDHASAGRDASDHDTVRALASMTIVGLVGSAIPVIIPSLIDALVRFKGLDPIAAASVMSAEMIGMTLSTAIVATLVQRFDRRQIALIGLVLTAIAAIGCLWVSSSLALHALRLLAGLGEGALIAVVAAALGGTSRPARSFGVFITANMLLSAALFRLLPVVLGQGGAASLFLLLLAMSVIGALALPFFPGRKTASVVDASTSAATFKISGVISARTFVALAGFLVFFTAVGIVWPLQPVVAASLNLAPESLASILSNATLTGLCAALLATFVGDRVGSASPLLVGGLLLAAGMAAPILLGAPVFPVAAAGLMGAWMFSAPFYLATLAAADASGRTVAFSMSLQFAGLAVGPLIGPHLVSLGGPPAAVWTGVILILVATILVISSGRRTG